MDEGGQRSLGSQPPARPRITKRSNNLRQHKVEPQQHIVVPESQHAITRLAQLPGPQRILFRTINMLSPIEFDDKAGIDTDEIDDEPPDGHLSTELAPQ
jgi:hypothetical protein